MVTSYDYINKIKARIKEARISKGLSVRIVASELGVTTQCVYKWETMADSDLPSIDHLMDICELYDVSADWLLFGVKEV